MDIHRVFVEWRFVITHIFKWIPPFTQCTLSYYRIILFPCEVDVIVIIRFLPYRPTYGTLSVYNVCCVLLTATPSVEDPIWPENMETCKGGLMKLAHDWVVFCLALVRSWRFCPIHAIYLPIVYMAVSLALGQTYACPSVGVITPNGIGNYRLTNKCTAKPQANSTRCTAFTYN